MTMCVYVRITHVWDSSSPSLMSTPRADAHDGESATPVPDGAPAEEEAMQQYRQYLKFVQQNTPGGHDGREASEGHPDGGEAMQMQQLHFQQSLTFYKK